MVIIMYPDKKLMQEGQESLEKVHRLIEDVKNGVFGSSLNPESGLLHEFKTFKADVTVKLEKMQEDVTEIKETHNNHQLGIKWIRNLGAFLVALFGIIKWNDFLHWLGIK